MIKVGEKIPDLEGETNHEGQIKKIDFTFVCSEILSISTDTVYVHKAWHTSKAISKIKFPMVADSSAKLCRAFGTYLEDEGVSLRATFIIDPDGIVKAIEMHDNSIRRSAKEILRKLLASKYTKEHFSEVCPASWEPGKETLKVSLELVGKI